MKKISIIIPAYNEEKTIGLIIEKIISVILAPFEKEIIVVDNNSTDSTKTIAQQYFPGLNRYVIKGTYQSQTSSEFQLNAINVPEGSVVVTAGTLKLTEGAAVEFEIEGQQFNLPVKLSNTISKGVAAMPMGLPKLSFVELPGWGLIRLQK